MAEVSRPLCTHCLRCASTGCARGRFHEKAVLVKVRRGGPAITQLSAYLCLVSIRTRVSQIGWVHVEVHRKGWCCYFDDDLALPIEQPPAVTELGIIAWGYPLKTNSYAAAARP